MWEPCRSEGREDWGAQAAGELGTTQWTGQGERRAPYRLGKIPHSVVASFLCQLLSTFPLAPPPVPQGLPLEEGEELEAQRLPDWLRGRVKPTGPTHPAAGRRLVGGGQGSRRSPKLCQDSLVPPPLSQAGLGAGPAGLCLGLAGGLGQTFPSVPTLTQPGAWHQAWPCLLGSWGWATCTARSVEGGMGMKPTASTQGREHWFHLATWAGATQATLCV